MSALKRKAPLDLILIGCGRISQIYLQAMASIPECRLKGVADIRKEAALSIADQNGCRAYTDYQQVLQGNHIDAVIICTPPNTHAEIATFFLENGVHVLCEKPFALASEEAGLMV
ncbi:MAG: Gfo/Idh/MocA family protein, partial [Candidatus Hodarchaeota archaeon]